MLDYIYEDGNEYVSSGDDEDELYGDEDGEEENIAEMEANLTEE